jgi:TonB family protein
VFVKKYVPLLLLFCTPLFLKAQTDTVTPKINALPYIRVDATAQFKGEPFAKYLSDHIHLQTDLKTGLYGNAVLAMKVENDGRISDARLLKTLSPLVDNEILRTVMASPKWQPAMLNGNPAAIYVVFNIAISIKGSAEAPSLQKQLNVTPVNTKSTAPVTAKPVKPDVLTQPEFPGGDVAFGKYLGSNIKYPPSAEKSKTEGVVFLRFIINADGTVGDIKIISSPSADLGQEAARVIKTSPKWKPATLNGKPIPHSYEVPIHFILHNQTQ